MKRKNIKGIIHNSFYKRNELRDTSDILWGRTQSPGTDIFEYKKDEKGKIVIIKKGGQK
ncbi:hypothetical protein AALC25_03110 [Lachnospiraceae bacterium 29-84]